MTDKKQDWLRFYPDLDEECKRAMLRFDLSALESGKQIKRATRHRIITFLKATCMGEDEKILEREYQERKSKGRLRLGAIGSDQLVKETEEKDKANRASGTDQTKDGE